MVDSHGVEQYVRNSRNTLHQTLMFSLAIVSQLYHRSDPAYVHDKGSPRACVGYLIEHEKYGWPGELFVQHGASRRPIDLRQIRGKFDLAPERPLDFAAPQSAFCTYVPYTSIRWRVTDRGRFVHVPATDAFHDRRLSNCNNTGGKAKSVGVQAPVVVHLHDTVAIDIGEPHSLFRLGQVVEVQGRVLKVRCFGRMSEFGGASEQAFKDPVSLLPLHTQRWRLIWQFALYITDTVMTVSLDYVKHVVAVRYDAPATYDHHPADIFHCRQRLPAGRPAVRGSLMPLDSPLPCCVLCTSMILNREEDLKAFRAMGGLPSADLYAGGGGTMIGKKGWFSSKLAVDLDQTACETLG